jgi:hypothetical protein
MKTTVKIPDKLLHRAKTEAALRGCKLDELVEDGLRLLLEGPRQAPLTPSLAELTNHARGMIDSGVPNLASNPDRLRDFPR